MTVSGVNMVDSDGGAQFPNLKPTESLLALSSALERNDLSMQLTENEFNASVRLVHADFKVPPLPSL